MTANGTTGPGNGQSAAARYDLSALEVTVVDDSPYMLKLIRLILRSMNVGRIDCHDQPRLALDAMERQPPDLLITDLLMAPLDGLELTRCVRRHGSDALCFTPIFVLSGFTDMAHVIEARDCGAHEVLAKPISVERLYRRIVSNIERPKRFIRAETYFGPERRSRPRGAPEDDGGVDGEDDVAWIGDGAEVSRPDAPGARR